MEAIAERNWGAEPWRAPKVNQDDVVLFDEPGRGLDGVCYRSHYFRMVRSGCGQIALLVQHGGGEERISEWALRKTVKGLSMLDSDSRYLMLYALYQMHSVAFRNGWDKCSNHYRRAFVDGRLTKRKVRGCASYVVKIKPEAAQS